MGDLTNLADLPVASVDFSVAKRGTGSINYNFGPLICFGKSRNQLSIHSFIYSFM